MGGRAIGTNGEQAVVLAAASDRTSNGRGREQAGTGARRKQRQTAGFAPQVRIGVHPSSARQVAQNFRGKGVHEAARISGLTGGGEILASRDSLESAEKRQPAVRFFRSLSRKLGFQNSGGKYGSREGAEAWDPRHPFFATVAALAPDTGSADGP